MRFEIVTKWDSGGIGCYCDGTNKCPVVIANCKITGNLAKNRGGAIYSRMCNPVITNCTFAGNSSPNGNAFACSSYPWDSLQITNSILRDGGNEIWQNGNPEIDITYSNVQGGWTGEGNIDTDPCFVQPGLWDPNGTPTDPNDDVWVDGDYRLLNYSPCINTGNPNYIAEPNEKDLDGLPRIIGGRMDMGAYEFNHFPVSNAGPDQTIEAQAPWGAKVTLNGSNSSDADSTPGTNDDIVQFDWYEQIDPCDPNANVPLGSGEIIDRNLPLGIHTVILKVTDKFGSSDSNEVTIIVQDTTPSTITCPTDITLEGTCPAGAIATFAATATDIVDPQPNITYSIPSGSMFPLGSTPVTCTAADSSGNSASCTFTVTVVDTTPPQLTLSVTPTTLWPLSQKMVRITPALTVTDLCAPNPTISLSKIQIYESGRLIGTYPPASSDIQVDLNGSIKLCAWRNGNADSRIYTITFQAVDRSGNSAQSSATVTVPHDQRPSK